MKSKIPMFCNAILALLLSGCINLNNDISNADLSALTVSEGQLSPSFSADVTVYTVAVANSVNNITITGTKKSVGATVSGDSGINVELVDGSNPIKVIVTSQDGLNSKEYTVTVIKAAADSTNANLTALTVSEGTLSPEFSPSTTTYSVSVANTVTSITVTGMKADSGATVSGQSGQSVSLDVGATVITVTVTAQNGTTTKAYVVTVTRAASTNANLSDLTVSEGALSPEFSPSTTAYSLSVANTVTSLTVTGTKADSGATVGGQSGQSVSLDVGATVITVTVTAQDGTTTKDYVVTVTRAALVSSNANLSALTVSQGSLSPVFSESTTEYSVNVANTVTSITVTGTKADSGATISGQSGQSVSLAVGANVITVTVTAKDGITTKDYAVTVTRASSGIVSKTINHTNITIDSIPASAINAAKSSLSVYYGHTSHGSQLMSGMDGLDAFKGGTGLYTYNSTGSGGALRIVETGDDAGYYPSWYNNTLAYLGSANATGHGVSHPEVNVVMWAWCGQLSGLSTVNLQSNYLNPMAALEAAYTGITFVYFTGHLDGTGTGGILNRNNNTIRDWCSSGNRWLYDFADIESYDPDGVGYLHLAANDECGYDSNGDGSIDANWAIAWQNAHAVGTDWYSCYPAHTQPVNGNMKAYAAWWLFARIAGWAGN